MALVIERTRVTSQLAILRTLALAGAAGLYTNAETPTPDSETADFDLPVWAGYANLATPSWTAIAADGDEQVMTHSILAWINAGVGSVDIYGWLEVDAGGDLVWAELFDAGPLTVPGGQGIILSGPSSGPIEIRQRSIP